MFKINKKRCEDMKMKKVQCMLLFFIIANMFLVMGCESVEKDSENVTISDIAYDNQVSSGIFSKIGSGNNKIEENDYTVYIEENDEFVPYLVLTSDYNGNTMLLRKYVLEEERPYNEDSQKVFYENSLVDKFLNDEYIKTLSDFIQDNIVNTKVLVTRTFINNIGNVDVEAYPIERKIFLISYTELGLERISVAKEGKSLEYFEHKKSYSAYAYEGREERIWYLRTPYLSSSGDAVWVVGIDGTLGGKGILEFGGEGGLAKSSVRPAFCVNNSLLIVESKEVIDGETVYVVKK
ncbi:DUF6273 domain-containing protein [Herbivorax sp. ANBcel31]|uniref:DUF6273 domain-containing protein n=1 Tax=Herbivorax sp. ANBcel31 TaxID=3069754 RepID=UPI0027B841B8|nr:DUF6273 domain-containing protein [Herbivorax sp. ANBcel31]MDQ2085345.1 DUF6273 domain-containing protein [Herbivorax sp. ANBcel31]